MYIVKKLGPVSFAIRLRGLMREKGMSQQKLADEIGVTKNTVTSWLKGTPLKRNKEIILKRLSELFEVDAAYLTCQQAERRGADSEMEMDEAQKEALAHVHDLRECVQKLINVAGYTIIPQGILKVVDTECYRFMSNGNLYEVAMQHKDGDPKKGLVLYEPNAVISIYKDNKKIFSLRNDTFDKICKLMEKIIIFYIADLGKDYEKCMSREDS